MNADVEYSLRVLITPAKGSGPGQSLMSVRSVVQLYPGPLRGSRLAAARAPLGHHTPRWLLCQQQRPLAAISGARGVAPSHAKPTEVECERERVVANRVRAECAEHGYSHADMFEVGMRFDAVHCGPRAWAAQSS